MRKLLRIVRWVVGVAVVLGLICGGGAAFIYPKVKQAIDAQAEAARGELVAITPAERGRIVRVVSAPGTLRATTSVNISSRVSAQIASIPKRDGEMVSVGEMVVTLDDKEIQAQVEAAEARLAADRAGLAAAEAGLAIERASILGTQASLDKASADFERLSALYESGDIAKSELDGVRAEYDRQRANLAAQEASLERIRANVESARAAIRIAEADLSRANENLGYTIIRSPIAGTITRVNMKEGEVALGTISNLGSTIMTIADLADMRVVASLNEVDVSRVREGMPVRIYINGYGDRRFTGSLVRVAREGVTSSDGTKVFDAEVVFDTEGERMFAGLTANIDIETDTLEDVIVVPSQAVQDIRVEDLPASVRENDPNIDRNRTFASIVYLYESGQAVAHAVQTGASSIRETAILAGLEGGERVITGPFSVLRGLRHNATVRLEEQAAGDGRGPDGVDPNAADQGQTPGDSEARGEDGDERENEPVGEAPEAGDPSGGTDGETAP
ncbi:MAG: efflux RND transporter periplasmic adaptor subunit [Phycisphaerales bacterium]